jgi:hypothetical protein
MLPGQPMVTVNPKHQYAWPFKGALSIVHTVLIVGTGIIIFKLGTNKGALDEIKRTLEAGRGEMTGAGPIPQPAHG